MRGRFTDPSRPLRIRQPPGPCCLCCSLLWSFIFLLVSASLISILKPAAGIAIFFGLIIVILPVLWRKRYTRWRKALTACEILRYDAYCLSEKRYRSARKLHHVRDHSDLPMRQRQRRQIGRLLRHDVDKLKHDLEERESLAKRYYKMADTLSHETASRDSEQQARFDIQMELTELGNMLKMYRMYRYAPQRNETSHPQDEVSLPMEEMSPPCYTNAISNGDHIIDRTSMEDAAPAYTLREIPRAVIREP